MAYIFRQPSGEYFISRIKPERKNNKWVLPEGTTYLYSVNGSWKHNYEVISTWVAETILGKEMMPDDEPLYVTTIPHIDNSVD